jgi:DNA-binding PadR family transcriptional regulator
MTESRLREFEELVLLAILVTAPDAYGPSIQQILLQEAGRDVSLGAIYTALGRLAEKGLVTSEMGDPTPVRGGRRKRHYELTSAGLERVREARRVRNRMWKLAGPEAKEGPVGS